MYKIYFSNPIQKEGIDQYFMICKEFTLIYQFLFIKFTEIKDNKECNEFRIPCANIAGIEEI